MKAKFRKLTALLLAVLMLLALMPMSVFAADSDTVTVSYAYTESNPLICIIANKVTVTFVLNDEDGTVIKQSFKRGYKLEKEEDTMPEREGYIFAGWYTDEELTEAFGFGTKITKSMTLYADWLVDNEAGADEWVNPYEDVQEEHWFYGEAGYTHINKLMNGVTPTTFVPDGEITRGMFATVLWRMEGSPVINYAMTFEDIDADAYYLESIRWAASEGVVLGFNETEFRPDANITREQMVAMIYRYAEYLGEDMGLNKNGPGLAVFTDVEELSEYAYSAMEWAVNRGLIKGETNTALKPRSTTTRAQAAALFRRVHSQIG